MMAHFKPKKSAVNNTELYTVDNYAINYSINCYYNRRKGEYKRSNFCKKYNLRCYNAFYKHIHR